MSPKSSGASKPSASKFLLPANETSFSSSQSPSTIEKVDIAIIGAGISGLALTIGLLKYPHISITIYETAPGFEEIGAGLVFGRNALNAMKLIDPRIYEGFLKIATERWEFFDYWWGMKGGFLNTTDEREIKEDELLTKQPVQGALEGRVESGGAANTVHRKDFLDVFVRLVPEDVVVFNKRATSVSQSIDGGKARLTFQDGEAAEADAVIGCDGIRSVARNFVLGDQSPLAKPVYSGNYCYRGLVDMERAKRVLGDRALERQIFLGYGGQVITFPVEGGKTLNCVAMQTSENEQWEHPTWTRRVPKKDMLRDFEGRSEITMKILELFEDNVLQWALFDHHPASTYVKDNICLLGDAAHACTPHAKAGAGQALEDAYILSNLLGSCESASSLPNAFAAYGSVRVPRTKRVIETSRARGRLMALQDELCSNKVDLGKIKRALHGDVGMEWIWSVKLEKELEKAMAVFGEKESGELGV